MVNPKLTQDDIVVLAGCDAIFELDEARLYMLEAVASFGRDNARADEHLSRAFVALRKAAEQMTKYKNETKTALALSKKAAA